MGSPEDISNISLVISVIALALSGISISWTIYEKIFLRPRSKVHCSISQIIAPEYSGSLFVNITITNLGPGDIVVQSICLRDSGILKCIRRQQKNAILTYDYTNLLNKKLPFILKQYEKEAQLIKYNKDCFLQEQFSKIGYYDSIGRVHWAKKSDVKKINYRYKKDFEQ